MGEGLCGACEVTARVGWAEAHLGGHRAGAARISAPWQSWRSHSWFGQHYHAHSLQRRRPQSSPAQGRLPGLPCGWVFVSLYHAHNLSKVQGSPGEGHRWHGFASPRLPGPAGTIQVGPNGGPAYLSRFRVPLYLGLLTSWKSSGVWFSSIASLRTWRKV